MHKTFKHSGDMGDIIFSLPTIKAFGGGILYLDPYGGINEPLVQGTDQGNKTKLNESSINSLKSILLLQPYIIDVLFWSGEKVDYNLDEFRKHVKFNNLADSHLEAFQLLHKLRDEKWLFGINEDKIKSIVIARSCRYQGNHAFWGGYCLNRDFSNHVFLGHKKEHELFEFTFNVKIDYLETPTLISAAKIIAGCDLLICNQNVLHAIGEGLKKPLIQEVYRPYPATVFTRSDAQYV